MGSWTLIDYWDVFIEHLKRNGLMDIVDKVQRYRKGEDVVLGFIDETGDSVDRMEWVMVIEEALEARGFNNFTGVSDALAASSSHEEFYARTCGLAGTRPDFPIIYPH